MFKDNFCIFVLFLRELNVNRGGEGVENIISHFRSFKRTTNPDYIYEYYYPPIKHKGLIKLIIILI